MSVQLKIAGLLKSVRVARRPFALGVATILGLACATGSRATTTTYTGNGLTDFGGEVGDGLLTVSDSGTGTVTFTFTPGNGKTSLDSNSLVLYISNGTAGLSNTRTLADTQDGGRTAISGDAGTNGQTVVNFATGFQANYGFSLEDSSGGAFAGVFGLPPSDPAATVSNLHYVTGANQGSEPIVLSIPLSAIGITEGQKFDFVGTLISTTAYRSDEAFGSIDATSNPGFNSPITFSNFDTFQTPEPASLGLLATAGLLLARRRTRVACSA